MSDPSRAALDRQILSLALPAAGQSLTTMGYLWVHSYWVGRLEDPAASLAALSVAGFTIWIHNSLATLVRALNRTSSTRKFGLTP